MILSCEDIENTVEPQFNEPLHNEVLGITNDTQVSAQLKLHATEP